MEPQVQWMTAGVELPQMDYQKLEHWIAQVARSHSRIAYTLNYMFCDDDEILRVNTVRTNADALGLPYERELLRVIIHGVLHLCGINDKGPGEREIMERAEDDALSLFDSL